MASIYFQPDGRNHNYFSFISDVMSLTAHIRARIDVRQLAIAADGMAIQQSGKLRQHYYP